MKYDGFHKRVEIAFTSLFYITVFLFFGFFYENHLHFLEQQQLFLLTGKYLLASLTVPGGFVGYIGEFFTQFYYHSLIGALIITLLLWSVQHFTLKIVYKIRFAKPFFPLSFIPVLIYWVMLCDEFYCLSGLVGFTCALLLAVLYISMKPGNQRAFAGLIMIPVAYYLLGGAYMVFVAVAVVYELVLPSGAKNKTFTSRNKATSADSVQRMNIFYVLAYLLLAIAIPLVVRRFFILENTVQAYISEFYYNILSTNLLTVIPPAIFIVFIAVPVLMIIFRFLPSREKMRGLVIILMLLVVILFGYTTLNRNVNFNAEYVMAYDHLARNEKWNEIIALAEKNPPRYDFSLSILNLALAKTGIMAERMFHYAQHDIFGLIIPFNEEYGFPIFGSEVFYHLGLVNAAQHYAFESLSLTPNNKQNVRSILRLAETNLINGHYKLSDKYLKLLEETLFYRNRAKQLRELLYHDELIDNHPVYGEKRKQLVDNDFFMDMNNMEAMLKNFLSENPQNRMAFEYLMGYYLVSKDLDSFLANLNLMEEMHYAEIPKSYQEAIYYMESLEEYQPGEREFYVVSFDVMNRLENYAYIYSNYANPQVTLRNLFSDTYWYYLHFM